MIALGIVLAHLVSECKATDYHESRPTWMSVWLMIIADNALHLLTNTGAMYGL